jgi:hypothetical protein
MSTANFSQRSPINDLQHELLDGGKRKMNLGIDIRRCYCAIRRSEFHEGLQRTERSGLVTMADNPCVAKLL